MRGPARLWTALIGLVALEVCLPAHAGVGVWTKVLEPGKRVNALAIAPAPGAKVYAATQRGFFMSTDGGASWPQALNGSGYSAVAVDPSAPAAVYLGWSDYAGPVLSRSTDSGATWRTAALGPTASAVTIAVHPTDSSRVFAGTSAGVFASTDAGNTWAWVGLSDVHTLAFGGIGPPALYAATSTGIYSYPGFGLTWEQLREADTRALAIDPENASDFYGGVSGGVIRSTDAGRTWTGALLYDDVRAIAIDPTSSSTLYAGTAASGVFKSTDAGATWLRASDGIGCVTIAALAIDRSNPSRLLAGTLGGGVVASADGAASWKPSNRGQRTALFSITAVPPGTTFATGDFGILRSTNGGRTWADWGDTSLFLYYVNALAAAPSDPTVVYASGETGTLFRSTDGGLSWRPSAGSAPGNIERIAIDPVDPSTVFTLLRSGSFLAPPMDFVCKTTDAGDSWAPLWDTGSEGANRGNDLALDPHDSSTVYTITGSWTSPSVDRVIHSTDGGVTWSGSTLPGLSTAYSVVPDPVLQATLYASGSGGLFRSTDRGNSWSESGAGLSGPVWAFVFDPSSPSTLYASQGGQLLRSTDGARTWQSASWGTQPVGLIAAAAGSPTTLLGSDSASSIWAITPGLSPGLYTLPPCRLLDTRNPAGPLGGPALAAGASRDFSLAGACGVPVGAEALSLNITAVSTSAGSLWLAAFDYLGSAAPAVSFKASQNRALNAIVPVAADGTPTLRATNNSSGAVDLVLDVNGFFW